MAKRDKLTNYLGQIEQWPALLSEIYSTPVFSPTFEATTHVTVHATGHLTGSPTSYPTAHLDDLRSLKHDITNLIVELYSTGTVQTKREENVRTALISLATLLSTIAQSPTEPQSRPQLEAAFKTAVVQIQTLLRVQPLWGTSDAEIRHQVVAALRKSGQLACACGDGDGDGGSLDISAAKLIVSALGQRSLPSPAPFIPTAIVTCHECGSMRLFHLATLGVL